MNRTCELNAIARPGVVGRLQMLGLGSTEWPRFYAGSAGLSNARGAVGASARDRGSLAAIVAYALPALPRSTRTPRPA